MFLLTFVNYLLKRTKLSQGDVSYANCYVIIFGANVLCNQQNMNVFASLIFLFSFCEYYISQFSTTMIINCLRRHFLSRRVPPPRQSATRLPPQFSRPLRSMSRACVIATWRKSPLVHYCPIQSPSRISCAKEPPCQKVTIADPQRKRKVGRLMRPPFSPKTGAVLYFVHGT